MAIEGPRRARRSRRRPRNAAREAIPAPIPTGATGRRGKRSTRRATLPKAIPPARSRRGAELGGGVSSARTPPPKRLGAILRAFGAGCTGRAGAGVAESVDAAASKAAVREGLGVRVPPPAPTRPVQRHREATTAGHVRRLGHCPARAGPLCATCSGRGGERHLPRTRYASPQALPSSRCHRTTEREKGPTTQGRSVLPARGEG